MRHPRSQAGLSHASRERRSPDGARLTAQTVLVIAQSLSHLPLVTNAAASALIPDAEFRIRQVIQDALKFMNHSKRQILTTNDINTALRVRNVDPVYGFPPVTSNSKSITPNPSILDIPSSSHQSQRHLSALSNTLNPSDATTNQQTAISNNATASNNRNSQMLNDSGPTNRDGDEVEATVENTSTVGRPAPEPNSQQYVQVTGIPHLFFSSDVKHNLLDLIRAPLPPVPLEVVLETHWLAIDGIQPKISSNPVLLDSQDNNTPKRPTSVNGTVRIPGKSRTVEEEDHKTGKGQAIIKHNIKHVLSRESQIYYDHVRRALFSYDAREIQTTLSAVSNESGIMQLVPYFALFVQQTVRKHLHDLPLLFSLMRLVWAMNENSVLSVDLYLHQLLPPVLTCVVGRNLSEKARHNHWALRDFAAQLLKNICERFESTYSEVKQRITITFCEVFQRKAQAMTQYYGAVVGLAALGPLIVEQMLIPQLGLATKLQEALTSKKLSATGRFQAAKVYCALAYVVHEARKLSKNQVDDSNTTRIVSIPPLEVADVIPGAEELLPSLELEFGVKVYPLGPAACDEEVANKILAIVDRGDILKGSTV